MTSYRTALGDPEQMRQDFEADRRRQRLLSDVRSLMTTPSRPEHYRAERARILAEYKPDEWLDALEEMLLR